jgi:UDP-N-acetylmuramate dehydrogenase
MQSNIQHNVSLSAYNTFGIHAHARFFSVIQSVHELQHLLNNPTYREVPKYILGGGSNVLFTEDYAGLILKNELKGIKSIAEDQDHVWMQAGAGENWHGFVEHCIGKSYGGVENLSLIPGTVGAAPMQNIGAYGVELKEVFHELEALNLKTAKIECFSNEQCRFAYRESIFKNTHRDQYIILNVTLKLHKKPEFNVSYHALQEVLKTETKDLTLKKVSDAVIQIRQSKLPDPKFIGNAGSFFKNPVISKKLFEELYLQFPTMPHFAQEQATEIKIPAAWLIEQCGWKGKRVGNVGVHDKQALILVNHGGGAGRDILDLAHRIQESVRQKFSISLSPEVNIL